jgi:hypothetical protein
MTSAILRLIIHREYALAGLDRGEAKSIQEALQVLASLGAAIVDARGCGWWLGSDQVN